MIRSVGTPIRVDDGARELWVHGRGMERAQHTDESEDGRLLQPPRPDDAVDAAVGGGGEIRGQRAVGMTGEHGLS
jgi:hypothetical protein